MSGKFGRPELRGFGRLKTRGFARLKMLSLASLLAAGLNGLFGAAASAEAAGDGTGSAVPFDSAGKYTDTLDSLDHTFQYDGVVAADGAVTGPGDLYYDAGSAAFTSVELDVTAVKWSLNYTDTDGLKVFETSYDSDTGTFTDGAEVPLTRKLRPDLLTNRDQLVASYVSGSIDAGTKYLHIRLPQSSYFIDSSSYANFAVNAVSLTSDASSAAPNEAIVDKLTDFSQLAAGADTSNLGVVGLTDPSQIWDARTFGNLAYVERLDATKEDRALTYEVPEGKTAKSVYAEGYFNFLPSAYFQVWASPDGTNYTNVTQSGSYHLPAVPYDSNWLPVTVDISGLPAGTRFVQIRLPAFTSGELYGMKHPRMTRVAIGYGDPGDDGGDAGETPGVTTIKRAGGPVAINGAIELGGDGKPTGEWQGANAVTLTGITDANGDEHSAKVYLQYDADNLYVGALIKDPTPMINENTGSNIWGGDNLEIFMGTEDLDFSEHPEMKNTMLPSDVQIVLSGSLSNGPQSYLYRDSQFTFPAIPLQATKDADGKGYTLEAAIPLSEIGLTDPWDDKQILLDPVLNDGGSSNRGQWGWTTTGETVKKNRDQWGKADLEAGAPPEQSITAAVSVGDDNRITVSGQTTEVVGKDVTLQVADPTGKLAYVDQAPSDSSGNYSFTFPIVGSGYAAGTYTAVVGGDGVTRPITVTFDFTPGDSAPNSGALQGTLSGPASAAPGSAIALQAGVQGGGDEPYNMLQAEIHYDKDKLSFDADAEDATRLAAGVVTPDAPGLSVLDAAIKPDQGDILVLLGSTDPDFAAQGNLFTLNAKVKADAAAGDTNVSLNHFQLSDESTLATAADVSWSIRVTAADHAALAAAIADARQTLASAVEGSGAGQYPAGSKATLQSAVDAAQAVDDDANATQEQLDAALAALHDAVTAFLGSVNPPAHEADKTALEQAVAAAQAVYDAAPEGDKVGQYPQAAKEALQAALDQANGVLAQTGATQADVDQAVATLQAAVQTFKAQLVTLVPGETQITIRDLSVLAKYFGATSDDPHWGDIAKADMFDEGEITIRSLAAIARLIVDDWLNE